ncbi:hypothetical protein SEA_ZION_28 [Corynebacterium phage Zion]|uniref:Uncharacterized protein n=3 Tax=Corynebacterium virus Zion TaxID=2560397 RepID=A0A2H4P8V0_9CAUD|nr:hypothetical protein FDJ12_gp28 [Corynebacterium phage Zion]ATW58646.1 hypothetical protein SEA_POTATOCHIP_28 [Corynebacterium phage PotatoChip]ATW58821.1 hypothetical protein SEA_ZION_28 [Corynebacterium phage Zion]AYR03309.1 hypothetical protein PETEYPAB_27 [Corynebacterium phage PeteyPab]
MDIDLTNLTDEQLNELRVEVIIEQERRQRMAMIPEQVRELAVQYEAGGGSRQALVNALTTEE